MVFWVPRAVRRWTVIVNLFYVRFQLDSVHCTARHKMWHQKTAYWGFLSQLCCHFRALYQFLINSGFQFEKIDHIRKCIFCNKAFVIFCILRISAIQKVSPLQTQSSIFSSLFYYGLTGGFCSVQMSFYLHDIGKCRKNIIIQVSIYSPWIECLPMNTI